MSSYTSSLKDALSYFPTHFHHIISGYYIENATEILFDILTNKDLKDEDKKSDLYYLKPSVKDLRYIIEEEPNKGKVILMINSVSLINFLYSRCRVDFIDTTVFNKLFADARVVQNKELIDWIYKSYLCKNPFSLGILISRHLIQNNNPELFQYCTDKYGIKYEDSMRSYLLNGNRKIKLFDYLHEVYGCIKVCGLETPICSYYYIDPKPYTYKFPSQLHTRNQRTPHNNVEKLVETNTEMETDNNNSSCVIC